MNKQINIQEALDEVQNNSVSIDTKEIEKNDYIWTAGLEKILKREVYFLH